MDRLEELIRRGLSNRQRGILVEKTIYCPDEDKLVDYIYVGSGAQDIEAHIADCPWCLEQAVIAYEAGQVQISSIEQAPQDALKRAKDIVSVKSVAQSRARALKRNLWLAATIIAFILSFVVPRYFLQFLAAALILGMKWIAESEQLRTLIITLDNRRKKKNPATTSNNRIKNSIEK